MQGLLRVVRIQIVAVVLVVAAIGVVAVAQQDPAVAQLGEVTVVASCRSGLGRVDTTIVNKGSERATYRVEVQGQRPRQTSIDAGDWGRVALARLTSGDSVVQVSRNGDVVQIESFTVRCGDDAATHGAGVTPVVACRNGAGFVLVQLVNDSDEPRPYVIEFDGVRNRSATVAAHGAAVRVITGRPDGVHQLTVKSGAEMVVSQAVDVTCRKAAVAVPESMSVAETTMQVLAAADGVDWSVIGGDDGSMFRVAPSTGDLEFVTPPDHELPRDADQDNRYVVDVAATEGSGATATGTLVVEVTDRRDNKTSHLPISLQHRSPVLQDEDGNPFMWWHDADVGTTMLLRCDDPTCDGDTPVALAIADGDVLRVAHNSSGLPVILLTHDHDTDSRTPAEFSILTCFTETCSAGLRQHLFTADVPMHVEFLLGRNDNPLVIFDQPSTGELMLLACPSRDCSGTEPQLVAQSEEPVPASLVLDSDGNPHIAFQLPYPQRFGLLDCTNPLCDGDDAVLLPKASVDPGLYVDHAIDEAGRPFVAWAGSVGDLWLLTCTDQACSDDVPRVVGAFDHSYEQVSIALNSDGLPTLLAESVTFDEVRLLACTNRTCAGDTPTSLFERPGSATNPIVGHAVDGNPTVAWAGGTPGGVVLIRCGDPSCSGDPAQPTIDGPTTFSVIENSVGPIRTLTTSGTNDFVIWALAGRADRNAFSIDAATGELRFVDVPDFERPGDSNLDNHYVVEVTATTARGKQTSTTIEISVLDEENEPTVSIDGATTVAFREYSLAPVGTLTTSATDVPVTWALTGRADRHLFSIDAATGELRFIDAPGVDVPRDSDLNNHYVIEATATTAQGQRSSATIRISVVAEPETGVSEVATWVEAYTMPDSAMAITTNGHAAFTYVSLASASARTLRICLVPDCTDSTTVVLDDTSNGGPQMIVADNEGGVVVAWVDTNADLVAVRCADTLCTGADPVVIVPDMDIQAFALEVGPDNKLTVAYRDSNGLQVMRCADPRCEGDQPTNLPIGPGDHVHLSMVLDEQGNPVVLEEQRGTDSVDHLFVCTDPDCRDFEATSLDKPGYEKFRVELKPDGTPTILMSLSGQIHVMSCTTPTCANDQPQPVGAHPDVPWMIAAELDEAGHPVIAYTLDDINSGRSELWVLTCSTPTCADDQPALVHRAAIDSPLSAPSIELTADGSTAIAIFQILPHRLLLIECANGGCGGDPLQ